MVCVQHVAVSNSMTCAPHAAGVGMHVYHSTDGGRTMCDITEAVTGSQGIDVGKHAPVPYFTERGLLLAFSSGQVAVNSGRVRCAEWKALARVPGAILSLCVDGRAPSSIIH